MNGIRSAFFVIKKRLLWILIITLFIYVVILPYQYNVLSHYGENSEEFAVVFIRNILLYNIILQISFIGQIGLILVNHDVYETLCVFKDKIYNILHISFLLYQLLVMPLYLVYMIQFSYTIWHILLIIIIEIITEAIFEMGIHFLKNIWASYMLILFGLIVLLSLIH